MRISVFVGMNTSTNLFSIGLEFSCSVGKRLFFCYADCKYGFVAFAVMSTCVVSFFWFCVLGIKKRKAAASMPASFCFFLLTVSHYFSILVIS